MRFCHRSRSCNSHRACYFGLGCIFYYLCIFPIQNRTILMTKNVLAAVSMPILITLAYILGNCNESGFLSELMSLDWLSATLASAFYSLAVFRARKITGKWSARLYSFEVLFPFAWIAICSFVGLMPIYTIFAFLTLPVAMGCSTTYSKAVKTRSNIAHDLATRTATLQIIFTVILSVVLIAF